MKINNIVIIVIVLILIITGCTTNNTNQPVIKNNISTNSEKNNILKSEAKIDESTLAAKVNTNYITLEEVSKWKSFLNIQKNSLPTRTIITNEDVLKQLIQYKLLASEAEKKKISVIVYEIDNLTDSYNNLAQNDLNSLLTKNNITIVEFKQYLNQTLVIQRLFEEISSNIIISEEEITNFTIINKEFMDRQLAGKGLSDKQVRDMVRLTLVDLKKEETKTNYIQNIINSSDITYYNSFSYLN